MQQHSKDCFLAFSAPTEVAVGGGDSVSKGRAIVEGVEGGVCLFCPSPASISSGNSESIKGFLPSACGSLDQKKLQAARTECKIKRKSM